jgi:hypothetical protein
VWRLSAPAVPGTAPLLHAHTGDAVAAQDVLDPWLDEDGRLFIHTRMGLGLVHTLDMETAAQAVEDGVWQPRQMPFAQMAAHFGHVLQPR